MTLHKLVFNVVGSTTWTSPAGVTTVTLRGAGGGGGGGKGATGSGGASSGFWAIGGAGGAGALFYSTTATVAPGTTYNINIGNGGSGSTNISNKGDDGGITSIDIPDFSSSSNVFLGGQGGHSGALASAFTVFPGGFSVATQNTFFSGVAMTSNILPYIWSHHPGEGGFSGGTGNTVKYSGNGVSSLQDYNGGTAGTIGSQTNAPTWYDGTAGGGGGGGPYGNGGAGGNGGLGAAGNPNVQATIGADADGFGGGGGGGGGGGAGIPNGIGGNGGSGSGGILIIEWIS